MQTVLAELAVSMSAFKNNPSAVIRSAGGSPVAVLNHNKVACYLLDPVVYEALLDKLDDVQLAEIVKTRAHEKSIAVELNEL